MEKHNPCYRSCQMKTGLEQYKFSEIDRFAWRKDTDLNLHSMIILPIYLYSNLPPMIPNGSHVSFNAIWMQTAQT